jgi:ankyrin repeat protein
MAKLTILLIFLVAIVIGSARAMEPMETDVDTQELITKFQTCFDNNDLIGAESCLVEGLGPNTIVNVVGQLFEKNDSKNTAHSIPLLLATVVKSRLALTKLLLDYGADPNIPEASRNQTLLGYLSTRCQNNIDLKLINTLLSYNANPNILCSDLSAPLFCATKVGSLHAARLLLAYSAFPNASNCAFVPLIAAALNRSLHHAHLLITYGADANTKGQAICTNQHPELEYKIDINPIFSSTCTGDASLVKLLLTYGADPNHMIDNAKPYQYSPFGSFVNAILLAHTASAAPASALLETLITDPLCRAAYRGQEATVRELLETSKPIWHQLCPKEEFTALHWAAARGHKDIINLLLEQAPSLLNIEIHETTALDLAAFNGHAECQALLKTHNGQYMRYTPLWWAIHKGDDQAVKQIVATEPEEINKQDIYHNTPVHKAAIQPKTPFLKLLMQSGADLVIKNNIGITPLELLSANKETCDLEYIGGEIFGQLLQQLFRKSRDLEVKVCGNIGELMRHIGGFLAQAHYQELAQNQKLPIKKALLIDTYAALKVIAAHKELALL